MTTEAVLSLGRQLSAELDDADTLGRWMAHYLSERLKERSDADNPAPDAEIADLIVRFWAHRAGAPLRHQPFGYYSKIVESIDRIDRMSAERMTPQPASAEHGGTGSDFQRIAASLVGTSVAASKVSSALLTELQLHAWNEEAAWQPYSAALNGGESDEAVRRLIGRMVARSTDADERRENLLANLRDLEDAARSARETVEQVALAKPQTTEQRTSRRRRGGR